MRSGEPGENAEPSGKSERTPPKRTAAIRVRPDVKTIHGASLLSVVAALAGCDAPTPPDGPPMDVPGIEVPTPVAEDPPQQPDEGLPEDHAPNCGEQSIAFDLAAPEVMLVLDKSGSMISNTWDHDRDSGTPEVTRWASLHQVVRNVTEDFDAQMSLGAVLFPAFDTPDVNNALACQMGEGPDASVSSLGGASVLASIPSADATEIHGGTPATAGIRMATEHLLSVRGEQPQAIVLLTDGAANCAASASGSGLFLQYDENLPVAAAEAFAAGIPVYVVGIDIVDDVVDIPVANPWERLSEVADYGGAPRDGHVPFYDVFDELELDDALSSIAQDVSCSVPVPEHFEAERMLLSIDGEQVPASDTCEGGEGWVFEGDTVRLCESTCQIAQVARDVEATLACIPEP